MRQIDADLAVVKCIEDIEAVKDISQRVDGILDAIMNIYECPTIESKTMRWIPCSEHLPEEIGDYFVTTKSGQIARYIYIDTNLSKEYWMRNAIAWMPLPKPWKGEKDEQ